MADPTQMASFFTTPNTREIVPEILTYPTVHGGPPGYDREDTPRPHPTDAPVTRAANAEANPFQCDATGCLKANLLNTLADSLNAAWNGWEMACKYKDDDMMEYYMRFVNLIYETQKKVKKIQ